MTPQRERAIALGRRIDWILTALIVFIAIGFIYMLQSLPQRATFFPWFITISIVVIATTYTIGKLRDPAKWDEHYNPRLGEDDIDVDTGPAFIVDHVQGIIRATVTFVLLVLGTMMIGPVFAVPIFVTISLWLNGENKIVAILSGIGFWMIVHFVFGEFMSINLPTGYLTETLGLT